MKTPRDIWDVHRTLLEFLTQDQPCAVATVLSAEGSTPRETGVKAVIDPAGKIYGTIGGGAVEAEAQRQAISALATKAPIRFEFSLAGEGTRGARPVCGGTMRILIDPTPARHRAAYLCAGEARNRRGRGALLTELRGDSSPAVSVRWVAAEAIQAETGFPGAEAILACLRAEQAWSFIDSSRQPEEQHEVLVEPLVPKPRLLIVGGGHIGQALALQANWVGFDLTVLDDRPEFTIPALFPEGIGTRCGDIAGQMAGLVLDGDTYVVIVTRGHRHDAEALAACIRQPAAYVGMIGSRRKVTLLRENFLQSGRATPEEFQRVFAPIGLDIGALTVPEIATSIVAQLIAVRRGSANAAIAAGMKLP